MNLEESFTIGYLLGKKNSSMSNISEDDWRPPDDWIPVPEPDPYEIYLLIYIADTTASYSYINIMVSRPSDAHTGWKALTIDWGDGTVDSWEGYDPDNPDYSNPSWGMLRHTYQKTGQYLIKIITTDQSCFFQGIDPYQHTSPLLIAKFGSEIILNSGFDFHRQTPFFQQFRLQYVVIRNTREETALPGTQWFTNCYSLRKVDINFHPTFIRTNAFQNCRSIKKFDFSQVEKIESQGLQNSGFEKLDLPKCVSIAEYAMGNNYSLKKVNAPICKTVGNGSFYQNFMLEKAVFSEDCTFGSDCFQNCWNLYSRPDGSFN